MGVQWPGFHIKNMGTNKRSMDLVPLLETCNWCDKWQFSADLFHSNIWPSSFTRYKASNLSDLEFDLLRSPLNLTFQGHSRSNVIVLFDSKYMLSY